MFEIVFHPRAQKSYERLDNNTARRINKAIDQLRLNPFSGKDIKKLRGPLEGKFRLRVGTMRLVYRVETKESLVIVESMGARGEIYKR